MADIPDWITRAELLEFAVGLHATQRRCLMTSGLNSFVLVGFYWVSWPAGW